MFGCVAYSHVLDSEMKVTPESSGYGSLTTAENRKVTDSLTNKHSNF